MAIRWKLNLTFFAFLAVFLGASYVAVSAVNTAAENGRLYSRLRSFGQLTSDIRTDMYFTLAGLDEAMPAEPASQRVAWPEYTLDDIEVQVRLAEDDTEREAWITVRAAISRLAAAMVVSPASQSEVNAALREAERALRKLRSMYELMEHESIVATAEAGLRAQVAVGVACALIVVLFVAYLVLVRDWLVTPINVLRASTDAIGAGDLEHRVPLSGSDELAGLARRIDAMASSLSQQQSELVEAKELSAIGELCANVAHGLRNPLASIRASAQLAQRQCDSDIAFAGMLGDVIGQADRMDDRITQLFEFSRQTELLRDCVTFRDLASAAAAEARSVLEARGVELEVEDDVGPRIWCLDGEKVTVALTELVVNAAHHSPEGSTVVIRGQSDKPSNGSPRALRVQVADRGAGIAVATLERIFKLFFTTRAEGTGIGLAMVRRVAKRHGGDVDVTSVAGEGTTATLTLPGGCPFGSDASAAAQCTGHNAALKLRHGLNDRGNTTS